MTTQRQYTSLKAKGLELYLNNIRSRIMTFIGKKLCKLGVVNNHKVTTFRTITHNALNKTVITMSILTFWVIKRELGMSSL